MPNSIEEAYKCHGVQKTTKAYLSNRRSLQNNLSVNRSERRHKKRKVPTTLCDATRLFDLARALASNETDYK